MSSYTTYLSSLFFPPSISNRDLHSFPTRRSSDLTWPISLPTFTCGRAKVCFHDTSQLLFAYLHMVAFQRFKHRSEEHTSELQSHSDLVCRLLLEKKKKNIYK